MIFLQDSLVSMVTRLWTEQSRNWGSIHGRGKRFFSPCNIQSGAGAHPAFYSMGIGTLSAGVKWLCHQGDSHLQVLKLRMSEALPLLPPVCLRGIHKDNFSFYST
jgi:hypothetical protein